MSRVAMAVEVAVAFLGFVMFSPMMMGVTTFLLNGA
jgi:hypothetical protein